MPIQETSEEKQLREALEQIHGLLISKTGEHDRSVAKATKTIQAGIDILSREKRILFLAWLHTSVLRRTLFSLFFHGDSWITEGAYIGDIIKIAQTNPELLLRSPEFLNLITHPAIWTAIDSEKKKIIEAVLPHIIPTIPSEEELTPDTTATTEPLIIESLTTKQKSPWATISLTLYITFLQHVLQNVFQHDPVLSKLRSVLTALQEPLTRHLVSSPVAQTLMQDTFRLAHQDTPQLLSKSIELSLSLLNLILQHRDQLIPALDHVKVIIDPSASDLDKRHNINSLVSLEVISLSDLSNLIKKFRLPVISLLTPLVEKTFKLSHLQAVCLAYPLTCVTPLILCSLSQHRELLLPIANYIQVAITSPEFDIHAQALTTLLVEATKHPLLLSELRIVVLETDMGKQILRSFVKKILPLPTEQTDVLLEQSVMLANNAVRLVTDDPKPVQHLLTILQAFTHSAHDRERILWANVLREQIKELVSQESFREFLETNQEPITQILNLLLPPPLDPEHILKHLTTHPKMLSVIIDIALAYSSQDNLAALQTAPGLIAPLKLAFRTVALPYVLSWRAALCPRGSTINTMIANRGDNNDLAQLCRETSRHLLFPLSTSPHGRITSIEGLTVTGFDLSRVTLGVDRNTPYSLKNCRFIRTNFEGIQFDADYIVLSDQNRMSGPSDSSNNAVMDQRSFLSFQQAMVRDGRDSFHGTPKIPELKNKKLRGHDYSGTLLGISAEPLSLRKADIRNTRFGWLCSDCAFVDLSEATFDQASWDSLKHALQYIHPPTKIKGDIFLVDENQPKILKLYSAYDLVTRDPPVALAITEEPTLQEHPPSEHAHSTTKNPSPHTHSRTPLRLNLEDIIHRYLLRMTPEELLTPKGFRMAARFLHPDKLQQKGSTKTEIEQATKDFQFVNEAKRVLEEDIDPNNKWNAIKWWFEDIQPIMHKFSVGVRVIDTTTEVVRTLNAPTVKKLVNTLRSGLYTTSMMYGSNYYSVGGSALSVGYAWYEKGFMNALNHGLISYMFMQAPEAIHYTFTKNPYVGIGLTTSLTLYTTWTAAHNVYSLYKELSSEENTTEPSLMHVAQSRLYIANLVLGPTKFTALASTASTLYEGAKGGAWQALKEATLSLILMLGHQAIPDNPFGISHGKLLANVGIAATALAKDVYDLYKNTQPLLGNTDPINDHTQQDL